MGMTIDEAIEIFTYIKNNPTNDVDAELVDEGKELFDIAIDTMRKYQEQTKHLKALQRRCLALTSGTMCLFCPMECVARKGVEDGNDRT